MCTSFKVVLLSIAIASVALAAPTLPSFLMELTQAQSREYTSIRNNNSLTKAQVATAEDAWAGKQTPNILASYQEYKTKLAAYNTELEARYEINAKNLTTKVKPSGFKLKLLKQIKISPTNKKMMKSIDF
uniref:DUF148 domain-containing protein n=1 Tax=Rhabditophanes sp. KR3021 TaxID=114890 RepID=A0AC35TYR2_9BILA